MLFFDFFFFFFGSELSFFFFFFSVPFNLDHLLLISIKKRQVLRIEDENNREKRTASCR